MNHRRSARIARAALSAAVASAVLLSACRSIPNRPDTAAATAGPVAVAPKCGKTEPVPVPVGVDGTRLQLLDEGKPFRVYTQVKLSDSRPDRKSLLPASMAQRVDLSPSSLTRSFSDTILQSRRFQVFDYTATALAEHSDVMVDVQIVDASQTYRPLEAGRRLVLSEVQVSVKVRNLFTGVDLLQAAVNLTGRTGEGTMRPTILSARDSSDIPEFQERLAADYKLALRQAFQEARYRIEDLLPPMGRVTAVDVCNVGLYGGSRFGFMAGDELIIFRELAGTRRGPLEQMVPRPVALVRCDGVNTDATLCRIVRTEPGFFPKVGDYGVITRDSLKRTREL